MPTIPLCSLREQSAGETLPLPISYMGTKKRLAPVVADVLEGCRSGPLLDLFAGMCAVGSSVSHCRQVWTNDAQPFAATTARLHFAEEQKPPNALDMVAIIQATYRAHCEVHSVTQKDRIQDEQRALSNEDPDALARIYETWAHAKCDTVSVDIDNFFQIRIAGSYFGLLQAIELDGLRASIATAEAANKVSASDADWMKLALCVAASKCATSTGHFAQPLKPKEPSIRRFVSQRRRSIREVWFDALNQCAAVRTSEWRRKNKAFCLDAVECLAQLKGSTQLPAVVYADPPYTNDQYSRYYHLLDTIVLGDVPEAHGTGRYRSDRFSSQFSLKAKVISGITELVRRCSESRIDLVLSYPENGLLPNARRTIAEIAMEVTGRSADVVEYPLLHSTMGGSKGSSAQQATELLFRIRSENG